MLDCGANRFHWSLMAGSHRPADLQEDDAEGLDVVDFLEWRRWLALALWMAVDISTWFEEDPLETGWGP